MTSSLATTLSNDTESGSQETTVTDSITEPTITSTMVAILDIIGA